MDQLTPFTDLDLPTNIQDHFRAFFQEQKEHVLISELIDWPFLGWWDFVTRFLEEIGAEILIALSPDYQSSTRLSEVINETKTHIEKLLELESDLPKALARFSDDQAVRILTIHKSKGLEFHSVIILAVENEIFFGDQAANRCAFFVGVSRAKHRLILTCAKEREKPNNHNSRWNLIRTPHKEYFDYA